MLTEDKDSDYIYLHQANWQENAFFGHRKGEKDGGNLEK